MPAQREKPRLLVCNIYFAPASFGGATVVAENLAIQLQEQHEWDVVVVSSVEDPTLPPYAVRRYSSHGLDVIGINIPEEDQHFRQRWRNEEFDTLFAQILEQVRPDMVHLHAVQGMGASILSRISERGIASAVTVHDCFWICERQFMVMPGGHYCGQWEIDLSVCRFCVTDISATRPRMAYLKAQLRKADRLLFPSAFHRDLHVANGFDARRCHVNKNGVLLPGPDFERNARKPEDRGLRFGFVGGPGPLKGANLIKQAFDRLERKDYSLHVVDAARHVGKSWQLDPAWDIPGNVVFVPPYSRDTIDAFFSGIDVLLFPSQWKESFGMTVREATARGIWVIATDAGGVAEDLADGVNATILPFGATALQLRDALADALEHPQRKAGGAGAIRSVEDQARELDAALHEVLRERPMDAA